MKTISIFESTIPQYIKMLSHLERFLVKAADLAERKKFDVNQLFQDRLSPDMLPLAKQIHIACDAAKFSGYYLTGVAAPKFDDTEKTLPEFVERIQKTREFLGSLTPALYEKDLKAKVELPRYAGKYMEPTDYVVQYSVPNFYFHITMSYALLRKNGVELGKMDYLGELPLKAL